MVNPKSVFCLIADIAYIVAGNEAKEYIDSDTLRYYKIHNCNEERMVKRLNNCLVQWPSFRNVFYFRIFTKGTPVAKLIGRVSRLFVRDIKTIEISGDIGRGFAISHNWSIIFPKRAGENFRVGPGVVIGKNRCFFPEIGDNVYIASNSTVIGDVVIGNNVIIGSGSVVVHDIPNNVVAVGNPARVIRSIEERDYDEIM